MKTLHRFGWAVIALALAHGSAHAAGTFTMTVLGPPDPLPYDGFARAITSLGDRLVIGAPGYSSGGLPGRVYVMNALGEVDFVIENPTPAPGDEFGVSITPVGDDLLVGAPFDDTAGSDAGAAYLFDGATGALLQTYLPPGSPDGAQCGRRVAALAGNPLLQCDGAYLFDVASGAVLQHFTTPSGVHNEGFGTFADDVVLGDNANAYRLDGSTGAVVATYPNPDPSGGSHPGQIAQLGTRLVIGRGFPHVPERVYIFDGGSGELLDTLVGSAFGTPYFERFGQSVVSVGDAIVVGAQLGLYRFDGATYERLDHFFSEDTSHTAVASELGTVFGTSYGARAYDPSVNDGRGRLFLFDRCGNGIRSGGEQCDDGNLASGDGCSPVCHLELCPATPSLELCRSLTPGSKSTLKLKSRRRGPWARNADQLSWKWKGEASTLADLGDPSTSANFQLCVYDDLFGSQNLVMDPAALPGDGWSTRGTGVRYRATSPLPSGIEKIDVRAGADGRAKVSVRARGFRLGLPEPIVDKGPLPLGSGLAVVLRNSETGVCWAAAYGDVRNRKGKVLAIGSGD